MAAYGRAHADRVRFHQWLQWLVDLQLESASTAGVAVMHDLAVGVDPGGADAWLWQDVFALDMAVGAPPDEFNTRGQDWGLPPFDPWRLRAAGYGPFVETIRASLRHAGGLRVDHVMGLFRLFWIARGQPAATGAYVRYPASELLDIVALEAHRAGAYVVGEDLGTVEDHVRAEMAARDVLSYKLLWFEDRPPPEYPERALAAVTTHDLPTVAGLWTGSDLEHQHRLGMEPNVESTYSMCRRLGDMTGVAADAPPDEVVAHMYTALGTAPCLLLTAALDDAVTVLERPNMPGTVDEWPNWSIALPLPLEELMADPRPRAVARALDRRPRDPDAGPVVSGGPVIEGLRLWLAATNAWIVAPDGPGGECVLIDAPPEPRVILHRLRENGLRLVALLTTHGHVDHVGGIGEVVAHAHDGAAAPAPVVPVHLHDGDRHMLLDPVGTGGTLAQMLDMENLRIPPPEIVFGPRRRAEGVGGGHDLHRPPHARPHPGLGVLPAGDGGPAAPPVQRRPPLRRVDRPHRPGRRLLRAAHGVDGGEDPPPRRRRGGVPGPRRHHHRRPRAPHQPLPPPGVRRPGDARPRLSRGRRGQLAWRR